MTEHDGKRLLLACRNEPRTAPLRGLTSREQSVMEYAALGHQFKYIAHELGLSLGAVSIIVDRVLRKLGLESRADFDSAIWRRRHEGVVIRIPPGLEIEIVEIDGETLLVLHCEAAESCGAQPILSSAEAEVLRALASGLTNAQIARARGTSPRTVANQVQSLLRKFGMQSRHQLGANRARL